MIIPAFRWATNWPARFYTIIHLPPLVGKPFTRNRGPGIYCTGHLRCKTKFSNQHLSFHVPTLNICCAFPVFCSFFRINACQSLSTRGAHPTIERSGFSPLLVSEVDFEVKGQVKRPNKMVRVMTESQKFLTQSQRT